MENWPKISVITPSYNQVEFVEATLQSVLNQGYPNLEYIVIDGGSSDGSVDVIRKYADKLAYWVSEPDRGQSHAINKGFLESTGEIICWLNSDDILLPGTLKTVAENLHSSTGVFAIVGHCNVLYADGRPTKLLHGNYQTRIRLLQYWKEYQMHQPAIFWRREVYEKVGLLDETLHYIMDFDYWARISEHFDFKNLDVTLAGANYHEKAKTGDAYAQYHLDLKKYNRRYWGSPLSTAYWMMLLSEFRDVRIEPHIRSVKRTVKRAVRLRPSIST